MSKQRSGVNCILCVGKNLFSNVQGKLHFTFMLNFPCLWVNDGSVAYGS